MTDLYEATKDLHHACEQHPVGQRMSDGAITPQQWSDWLGAFRRLHWTADSAVPGGMRREKLFRADLSVLPQPARSVAVVKFEKLLEGEKPIGLAYVLHGAHRSGGRVLAPRMAKRGLPSLHVIYRDAGEAKLWVEQARGRGEFAEQARAAFRCLLSVMDEIEGRSA